MIFLMSLASRRSVLHWDTTQIPRLFTIAHAIPKFIATDSCHCLGLLFQEQLHHQICQNFGAMEGILWLLVCQNFGATEGIL
jgi:hypothetical protein